MPPKVQAEPMSRRRGRSNQPQTQSAVAESRQPQSKRPKTAGTSSTAQIATNPQSRKTPQADSERHRQQMTVKTEPGENKWRKSANTIEADGDDTAAAVAEDRQRRRKRKHMQENRIRVVQVTTGTTQHIQV